MRIAALLLFFMGCGSDDNGERQTASAGANDDGEAFQALVTANDSEIDAALIAITRAIAPSIQAFARGMLSDHTEALRSVLVQLGGKIPASSGNVNQLFVNESTRSTSLLLTAQTGSSFDLVYLCSQVRMHAGLIQSIDASFTQIQDPQLAAQVMAARTTAQSHLTLAERLIATMSNTKSSTVVIPQTTEVACASAGGTTFGLGNSCGTSE